MKKTILRFVLGALLAAGVNAVQAQDEKYKVLGKDTIPIENILFFEQDTIYRTSYDVTGHFRKEKIIDTDAAYYRDGRRVGAAGRRTFFRIYGAFDEENIVRTVEDE